MIRDRDSTSTMASRGLLASCPPPPPDHLRTMVQVARWRAGRQPGETVYTFLDDGEQEGGQLSYAELDDRARRVAAGLQRRGAAGQRVLLLFPPGLQFNVAFFGCLYAGAVAVPAYPPDPLRLKRTLPRLEAILRDAQAKFVFGSEEILRSVRGVLGQEIDPGMLALEGMEREPASAWSPAETRPDDPCLLQYTSGSTGTPRGVILTHGNVMHNLWTMHLQDSEGVVGVIWLPPYHDLGLIGGVLLPMYSGRRIVVIPPLAFLEQPLRWLRAISRYRVKTAAAPTFGYDLCVRRFDPAECEGMDLRSWNIAVVGAEPVRAETIEGFIRTFAPYGFRPETFMPAYGLAEAVLHVTGGQRGEMHVVRSFSARALEEDRVEEVSGSDPTARRLVGCGRPIPGERIAIVDPKRRRELPRGRVGEIWVQSPSVAQGYWNRPEETERVFHARLAGEKDGVFLRTGDLGFLHKGQLFIAGRLKELIILGGRNFYPQDIEQTVAPCHPALQSGRGAAFSWTVQGEERLVVVHETRRSKCFDYQQILARIRQELAAEYLVSPYAVVLIAGGSLPKTTSGKIRRRACRELFADGQLDVVAQWRLGQPEAPDGRARAAPAGGGPRSSPGEAGWGEPAGTSAGDRPASVAPRTPLEAEIAAVWAQVLGRKAVGVEDNFFALGGHSLLATQLYFRLRHLLPADFPLEQLFQRPTVAGLAELIVAAHVAQDDSGGLPDLLGRLERMSEDEARRLLGPE